MEGSQESSSKQPENEENSVDETSVHGGNDKTANCYNPSAVDDLQDDELTKVKGDAIGDTLYSERFVLHTLLKLTKLEKPLTDDENFEKDLCTLWDMTIEEDVVLLLLEHNVLELFAGVVQATDDRRLTEILVGIVGNMSNVAKARNELCARPDITAPIIDLISCSDSLTLIQLMRFLLTTLVFENSGDEYVWFQHFKNSDNFVQHFSYLLMNSVNTSLLIGSYEALNAICAKFAVIEIQDGEENLCFRDVFVQPCLVVGVTEAFRTLMSQFVENSDDDDTSGPTQKSQKIMSLYLDIHVILSQYDDVSRSCYDDTKSDLLECISNILTTISQPVSLFPLSSFQQGVIENTNEISMALDDPFEKKCFAQMITIWNLIHAESSKNKNGVSSWEDESSDNKVIFEDSVDPQDLCNTILEYVVRTALNTSTNNVGQAIDSVGREYVNIMLEALQKTDESDFKDCFIKIKAAINNSDNDEAIKSK